MRVARWGVPAGIVLLILALVFISRAGDAPTADVRSVGTSGHGESAPEPEDSPATLHDLETVTGSVDPHQLVGSRVDFHLQVRDINNNTSFWVGTKDNPMLVVLERANRSEAQPITRGEMARITGTIEAIPLEESRFNWGVNDSVRRALKDQQVYIRADNVVPEG